MLSQTRFTILGQNPNDIATLLVMFMLSLPVLVLLEKRYFAWIIAAECVCFALLAGTGSRGAALALIGGGGLSLFLEWQYGRISYSAKTWGLISVLFLISSGVGLFLFPKGIRFATLDMAPDASAGRRLELWSSVPSMIVAAPEGWGNGKAAEAYEEWFQPLNDNVRFLNLVSSHFTWLVEFNWWERWLYLLFWVTALLLVWPSRTFTFPAWGAGVWLAYLTALFFNPAGEWWNWPLPVIWLLFIFFRRMRHRVFPSMMAFALAGVASGILLLLPFMLSQLFQPGARLSIHNKGKMVLIGEGEPSVAILEPNKKILGDFYGKDVRQLLSKNGWTGGSIAVITRPYDGVDRDLSHCHTYLFSGADNISFIHWIDSLAPDSNSHLILINCRVQPSVMSKPYAHITYVCGAFYANPYFSQWRKLAASISTVTMVTIPTREAYIPEWSDFFKALGNE